MLLRPCVSFCVLSCLFRFSAVSALCVEAPYYDCMMFSSPGRGDDAEGLMKKKGALGRRWLVAICLVCSSSGHQRFSGKGWIEVMGCLPCGPAYPKPGG